MTGSACRPAGRQLPAPLPRLSRRLPAWHAAALQPRPRRAGQQQPCTGWDACDTQPGCPGHAALRLSHRAARFGCFPSKFRLEHTGTARLSRAMSAPGAGLGGIRDLFSSQQTGDHSPSVLLLGTGLYGWPQASAVSDPRRSTAVRPWVGFVEKTAAAL